MLLLVVTAGLWSIGGVIIKNVAWNPLAISSCRGLFAGLTLIVLTRKTLDLRWPDRAQWFGAVLLAVLSTIFVVANKLTTAANVVLLQFTAPVWVALIAPWLLKERTRPGDWFFIGLALAGLALFFMEALSIEGLLGNALALVNGLIFAGVALAMRHSPTGSPMKMLICGFLLAASLGLVFWRPPWPSPADLGLIALAGVVQLGLPYYLYSRASEGVSSLEMVLVTALEPILNPIWVFLVVGERPSGWSLAGGAVVLVTVTVWSVLKARREGDLPP